MSDHLDFLYYNHSSQTLIILYFPQKVCTLWPKTEKLGNQYIINYKLLIITFYCQTVHGTPTETRKSAKVAFSQIQKVMTILILERKKIIKCFRKFMFGPWTWRSFIFDSLYLSFHSPSTLQEILCLEIASVIPTLQYTASDIAL